MIKINLENNRMGIIKPILSVCLLSFSLTLSANEMSNSFDLDLEELLGVEVTSVSKQRQPLSDSPAAIYVLSNKDIMRSGATSIPQALRDVPGLHVAQIDAQNWAVSSRGFNGRFNNKLLVLMDGRALYSPGFSGVYWEVQDTLMSDIERIEVIRGPSAAMWGANAVNGVINIITKHSADTLGGYAELGVGDYEKGFAGFRYGAKLSDTTTARVYAKSFERDALNYNTSDMLPSLHALMAGVDADNSWRQHQFGGRLDMQVDNTSTLTLSTDAYQSDMNQVYATGTIAPPYSVYSSYDIHSKGWNVLAHYTKALSANSEYSIKAYYDKASRQGDVFSSSNDTVDLDFQHQYYSGRHNIVWGLGYRYIHDDIQTDPIIQMSDASISTHLWSGFLRDEITLLEDTLWLTLATRIESNSYTDVEWQPNARLMWKLNEQHKLWSSIAYSVRTPSRAESSFDIHAFTLPTAPYPTKIMLMGNDGYESETLMAYEIGYRFSPTRYFSMDSTIFYNDYKDLRSINFNSGTAGFEVSPAPHAVLSLPFANDQEGSNLGFELSSQWVVNEVLKLKLNYAYVHSDFGLDQAQNTDAPKHIGSLNADWVVNDYVDLNVTWRYVDQAKSFSLNNTANDELASYQGVDIGARWQVSPNVNLSLYGKNLFQGSHVEYESELFSPPYRVEPSVYGKITFSF